MSISEYLMWKAIIASGLIAFGILLFAISLWRDED